MPRLRRTILPSLLISMTLSACSAAPATVTEIRLERRAIPRSLLEPPPLPAIPVGGTLRDLGHYVIAMEQATAVCVARLDGVADLLAAGR